MSSPQKKPQQQWMHIRTKQGCDIPKKVVEIDYEGASGKAGKNGGKAKASGARGALLESMEARFRYGENGLALFDGLAREMWTMKN